MSEPTTTHTPDATSMTEALADFIACTSERELPASVDLLARLHLLDTLSSVVACRDLRAGDVARKYAASHSGGGPVPILGTLESASLTDASFASAIIAHGAEINDFCPSAFVQPGPGVVAAAMCIGADRSRSGTHVLRAVAAGYEIACRMPKAVGVAALRSHGLANHSIGSIWGVATASGALLGFDRGRAVDLIAYTAQQSSGSWQWLLDIEHLEKAFVFGGMAAHDAVHAALIVDAGFTGVPDALDAPGGWLRTGPLANDDGHDMSVLTDGLGESFQIDLVGFKQYPVGGPVQPIISGMLQIAAEHPRREVAAVRISMPGSPATFSGARMPALNARYLTALILIDGRLDFVDAQSLERFHGDTAVDELMERITLEHDPDQEGDPRPESARIEVDFADGGRAEIFVDHVRGYPSHPMSEDDVIEKASGLLAMHFDDRRVERIVELTMSIGELDTVEPIIESIARA